MTRGLVVTFAGLALAGAACHESSSAAPAVPADQLIQTITDLADRACDCGTDKDCLHQIRDEFDGQKFDLLKNGGRLTGDDRAEFDKQHTRLRACGDAGGLTFWDH